MYVRLSNLLCFPELLNDLRRHLVVLQEVIGDGVADPGSPLGRTQLQQLVPRLLQKEEDQRGERDCADSWQRHQDVAGRPAREN